MVQVVELDWLEVIPLWLIMWSLVRGSGHLDDEVDPGDVEGSDRSLRQTNTPGQHDFKGQHY